MEKRRTFIGLLLCLTLALIVAVCVGGCVTEKYSYLELYGTYEGEIEKANASGTIEKKGYELKLYLDGTYEAKEIKGDGRGEREYGSFRFSPIALENYRITMSAEVAVDGNGRAEETDKSVFGTGGLTHVQKGDDEYGLESDGVRLERTVGEAEDTIPVNVLLGVFGGTVNEDVIAITVDESVDRVKVGDFLYFSPGTVWNVYYDYRMTTKLASKVARLDRGDTELYLTVGEDEEYSLDFYREYENTVVFESEGAEVGRITVKPNGEIAEDALPFVEKTGYELTGWKDEAGKVWNFAEKSAAIDAEYGKYKFTAVWEACTYNVELKVDGEVFSSEEVVFDNEYGFPTPEKAGCIFSGWSDGESLITDGDGNGTGLWQFAGDKELTAEWTKQKYTVSVVSETADGGEYTGTGEYEYGAEAVITVTPENGYTFAGWYADGEKIGEEKTVRITVGAGDEVLTAVYEEYFVVITVNGAKGNAVVINARTEVGTLASPISFISEIPEGVWDGWYENGEKISADEDYSFLMTDEDKSLEARWVADGVRTAADFMAKIAANEDIELASDIDFAGVEWTVAPEYFGNITGNGYAVRNLTVNKIYEENGVEYAGLFAEFCGSAEDVAFENISVEVSAACSVNAGLFAGRVGVTATVRNVTVSGKLTLITAADNVYVGGFAGENRGAVEGVSVSCAITVLPESAKKSNVYAGGFVAVASALSLITDCEAGGTLRISYSANGKVTVATDDFAVMADSSAEFENVSSDITKDILVGLL